MRISTLECFVFLNEIGSFHATAKALNLSQPALSRRISNLEKELGAILIDRTQKAVALTPIGRDFLESSQEIVALAGNAVRRTREVGSYSGRSVSVSSIPSLIEPILLPSLQTLRADYKLLRTPIFDANSECVVRYVADGDVDFGIGISMSRPKGVHYESLFSEPLCLVCGCNHPLAKTSTVGWKNLEDYPVSYNATTSGNWLRLQSALKSRDVRPDWQFECLSLLGVMTVVAQDEAVAIAPVSLSRSRLAQSLVFHRILDDPIEREVGLFFKSATISQNLAEKLVEIVQKNAAEYNKEFDRSSSIA